MHSTKSMIMESACTVCGSYYTAERSTSKYCSDKCKQKLRRQKAITDTTAVLPSEVSVVEAAVPHDLKYGKRIPSRQESQLSDVAWRLYFALSDLERIMERNLLNSQEEIISIVKRAKKEAVSHDILWEVEGFDIEDKYFDPAGFTHRTGILTSHK